MLFQYVSSVVFQCLKSLQRSTKQDAWIASEDCCVSQGSHAITVQDLPSIRAWLLSSSNACADCLLSTGQSYCWTGSNCHGGWTLGLCAEQGACLFYLSHEERFTPPEFNFCVVTHAIHTRSHICMTQTILHGIDQCRAYALYHWGFHGFPMSWSICACITEHHHISSTKSLWL